MAWKAPITLNTAPTSSGDTHLVISDLGKQRDGYGRHDILVPASGGDADTEKAADTSNIDEIGHSDGSEAGNYVLDNNTADGNQG